MNCALTVLLASLLINSPLSDSMLEPSVLNEVHHALARSENKSMFGDLDKFKQQVKSLSAGSSLTDIALKLVSTQKSDGRWYDANTNDVTCAARYVLKHVSQTFPKIRYSVFSDHIHSISEQRGISLAEAAKYVRSLGIEGVEVWSQVRRRELKIYTDAGLKIACVVWFPKFVLDEYDALGAAKTIKLAKDNGASSILVVPAEEKCSLENKAFAETRKRVIERTERFAKEAAKEGVFVCVEDYDNSTSPTHNIANTEDFLRKAPSVGFVFDTGNFMPSGDDAREAMLKFAGRIRHIHLKDRDKVGKPMGKCVPFGYGVLPAAELVKTPAMLWGYDMWYTLEHFGAEDMVKSLTDTMKFLKALKK